MKILIWVPVLLTLIGLTPSPVEADASGSERPLETELTALPPPPPGPSSDALRGEGVESGASSLAEHYGLSAEEAQTRILLQADQALLIERTRSLFPDTYAGAWVDHTEGGSLKIAFSADAQSSVARVIGREDPGFVVVPVHVPFSEVDLDSTAAALESALPGIEAVAGSVVHIRVRSELNRVEVGVSNESVQGVERLVDSLVTSSVPVEVVAEDVAAGEGSCYSPTSAASGESRDICPAPLKGGITLANRDRGNSNCTMSYNATGGGGNYIITAGHCYSTGEVAGHYRWNLGYSAQSINSGNVDATRIYRASNFSAVAASRWILDSTSDAFQIRRLTAAESYGPGMVVCSSGRRTFKDCGQIISNDASSSSNDDQIEFYACGRASDSGSPMYDDTLRNQAQDGTAVGVNQAFTNVGSTVSTCSSTDRTWGSQIQHVQTRLGVGIKIS